MQRLLECLEKALWSRAREIRVQGLGSRALELRGPQVDARTGWKLKPKPLFPASFRSNEGHREHGGQAEKGPPARECSLVLYALSGFCPTGV